MTAAAAHASRAHACRPTPPPAPRSPSVLFRVDDDVVPPDADADVDALYEPVELHLAGPLGQSVVAVCDEPALRAHMRPPRLSCRVTITLPAANANGHWEIQVLVQRSGTALTHARTRACRCARGART